MEVVGGTALIITAIITPEAAILGYLIGGSLDVFGLSDMFEGDNVRDNFQAGEGIHSIEDANPIEPDVLVDGICRMGTGDGANVSNSIPVKVDQAYFDSLSLPYLFDQALYNEYSFNSKKYKDFIDSIFDYLSEDEQIKALGLDKFCETMGEDWVNAHGGDKGAEEVIKQLSENYKEYYQESFLKKTMGFSECDFEAYKYGVDGIVKGAFDKPGGSTQERLAFRVCGLEEYGIAVMR